MTAATPRPTVADLIDAIEPHGITAADLGPIPEPRLSEPLTEPWLTADELEERKP